jgi:amino acid transporter
MNTYSHYTNMSERADFTMKQHSQHATAPDKQTENAGQLGPLLCWAVVFADIGTSIYYVPGILYQTVNALAGFFVFLTMLVFILLTFKYVEVTYRFPQGGGVVTVSARAINRWFGALGGMFILVDYFLTAAISCLSGILYFSVIIPSIGPQHAIIGFSITVWIAVAMLALLGVLNWIGVSTSAKVSMVAAVIAFVSDLAILITVFTHLSMAQLLALFPKMFSTHTLTPVTLLVGFAGSFLAFSGLESISQLSPVMKLPRGKVGRSAMFLVVLTIGLTSPLLVMFSTLLLPQAAANSVLSSQLISLLAGKWGGPFLQTEVAISAGALLIFASNTAIIGSYHVFLALARMEFFPQWLLKLNKLRKTPHISIATATLIPIIVLLIVHGNINTLGDMYAFGLLGAFSLTCISMDIVRFRERKIRTQLRKTIHNPKQREVVVAAEENALENEQQNRSFKQSIEHLEQSQLSAEDEKEAQEPKKKPVPAQQPEPAGAWSHSTLNFILGILTTFLVLTAWSTNLVAKPLATAFGGTVVVVGMLIAYTNYRHTKKKGRVPVLTTGVESNFNAQVLAILESDDHANDAIIDAVLATSDHKAVVFLYLGKETSIHKIEPFRMIETHLNDNQARELLGRINARVLTEHRECRFVFRQQHPGVIEEIWQSIHPNDTLISTKQEAILHEPTPSLPVKVVPDQTNDQFIHLQKVQSSRG